MNVWMFSQPFLIFLVRAVVIDNNVDALISMAYGMWYLMIMPVLLKPLKGTFRVVCGSDARFIFSATSFLCQQEGSAQDHSDDQGHHGRTEL